MKMGQDPKTVEKLKIIEARESREEQWKQEKTKGQKELRRSPRLACEGLAGVQTLPACDKPCPATIMNLSIGGCLMELDRPLSLAINEMVELIFCVNRMPFRVRGRVRFIRSATRVGFQFPQPSERVRRQLEELVGELIGHLAKLHQKSISNRLDPDRTKKPHLQAALPPCGDRIFDSIKRSEGVPGDGCHRPEPRRRWF